MTESKWKRALCEALARENENYPCPGEEHIFSAKFKERMNKLIGIVKSAKKNEIANIYKKRQE